jgi:hypothetical protein
MIQEPAIRLGSWVVVKRLLFRRLMPGMRKEQSRGRRIFLPVFLGGTGNSVFGKWRVI